MMIAQDATRHRKSLDHGHICELQNNHVHAQDLKTSLNELQERIQSQVKVILIFLILLDHSFCTTNFELRKKKLTQSSE